MLRQDLRPAPATASIGVRRVSLRLNAWITTFFARLRGRFDPENMSRESLGVLGAAIALMSSAEGGLPVHGPGQKGL